ncbi:MAG: hypothetical protein HY422_03215 [Candidatus Komeilibacteria bacterium]|nr:hypothetical protein [Candidatus Komeilibacteria bacterium]
MDNSLHQIDSRQKKRDRFQTVTVNTAISAFATAIALIPFWIYLGIRVLLQPEGFWQNLVLTGIGVWLMGGIQASLFIVLLVVLYFLWAKNP